MRNGDDRGSLAEPPAVVETFPYGSAGRSNWRLLRSDSAALLEDEGATDETASAQQGSADEARERAARAS